MTTSEAAGGTHSLPVWSQPAEASRQTLSRAAQDRRSAVLLAGNPKAPGHGTAFVISKKHRLLVTNAHVADLATQFDRLLVILNGTATTYPVEKVWYHPGVMRFIGNTGYKVGRASDPKFGSVYTASPDLALLRLGAQGPDLPAEFAVENVRERLERTVRTLEEAGIPYAIIGGYAVRAWVAQADEAAVRTTRDVDVLLRRSDFPAAIAAMERAGFVYRHVNRVHMFLEAPNAKARDAVHVVFAREKVRAEDPLPAPDVSESEDLQRYRTLRLEPLVRMKLTAFRDKDRRHLRDMIDVELVDESWCSRLPPELASRLKELLDNPDDLMA